MITIVYAHPWTGSFNHAILETVTQQLDFDEENYNVIDLYADGFNPTMTTDDLRLYSKGKTADKNADRYRHILSNTTEIIFIFPIWWGMIPANLKGFFDKTLLRGGAFNHDNKGRLVPALHIKRTVLITTSQGETAMYKPFIEDYLIPNVLNAVGMTGTQWYNCDRVSHGPEENRKNFLKYIAMVI
ncbi:MAG: NAD(P)H-dependent oxidoreductase [Muribaculaceae bacterium]|nr:NAD(P)H-dependent oxidoreductase [Muribaculaceae bacterium]